MSHQTIRPGLRAAAAAGEFDPPPPATGDDQQARPDAVVVEHRQKSGWGGQPGDCGAECACGTTYDGFDTIREAGVFLDRHIIRARDGDVCRYCGRPCTDADRLSATGLTFDPVDPDADGVSNLVVACRGCKTRKGRRTPEAAGMVLRPVPGEQALGAAVQPLPVDVDGPDRAGPAAAVPGDLVAPKAAGQARVAARDLDRRMWVATGDPNYPGVEVKYVELSEDSSTVGVVFAGPHYREWSAEEMLDLVDAAVVRAAAERARVRERRETLLDALQLLVDRAIADPDLPLPDVTLQLSGSLADEAAVREFAAAFADRGAAVEDGGYSLTAVWRPGATEAGRPLEVEFHSRQRPGPASVVASDDQQQVPELLAGEPVAVWPAAVSADTVAVEHLRIPPPAAMVDEFPAELRHRAPAPMVDPAMREDQLLAEVPA